MLHKNVTVSVSGETITVELDIVPDEYEPYAMLTAKNAYGEQLASVRVRPDFKLNTASASAWIETGYRSPR